jgi:hypothetical protein
MAKSSENIVLNRVGEVATMLINGSSREDIVQYSSEKWHIGERQTDKYIQKAKESIRSSVKQDIRYDYAKAIKRYEYLYKMVIEKKDYKTALSINKELTNLQGLLIQPIENNLAVQFINNIPD